MKPSVIAVDPEIMSGAPCFAGTRVPVQAIFDYLDGGHPLADFLADFPTVTAELAHQLLADEKRRTAYVGRSRAKPNTSGLELGQGVSGRVRGGFARS